MRKWILLALMAVFSLQLRAQEPYPELGAKLDEYFTALAGSSAEVQMGECDYLISSCQDSLVQQYVTLKIYDHYLKSKIMGDDAVAVHVADKWLLSRKVAMNSSTDLMHARIFADFNRSSLIGMQAPRLSLLSPEGEAVKVPSAEGYSVLYFYDTSCATCKVETPRLKAFVAEGEYPLNVFAIYTGADADSWAAYREGFPGVTHLWDPEVDSDWQRLYGVLQTPKMFLIDPSGKILGRSLDTPALRILLKQCFESGEHVYGEAEQMAQWDQLFAPYGDSLTVSKVMEVADYLAIRSFGEGDIAVFKQMMGDLLYYLSSQRTEVYRDAVIPFVKTYIQQPDVWNTPADQAQVVSLGEMLVSLSSRTPQGSLVPDLTVPGVLRRKGCLFAKSTREGRFSLRSLKGNPGYIVFYTGGCSSCQEVLAAVDALVAKDRRARVLLVDMDAVLVNEPDLGSELLDSFDLSALPFVLQLDASGIVQHRYVQL